MKNTCRYCSSFNLIKGGIVNNGNQRYKCKNCNKTFTITNRKYSNEFKLKIIKMYLESIGIRSIERLENVSNVLIIYWIRNLNKILEKQLKETENIRIDKKNIVIMKIDEMMTFYKKKLIKFGFELLSTETQMKFWILK